MTEDQRDRFIAWLECGDAVLVRDLVGVWLQPTTGERPTLLDRRTAQRLSERASAPIYKQWPPATTTGPGPRTS